MPEIFCLEANYEESAKRIAEMRDSLLASVKSFMRIPEHKRKFVSRRIKNFLDFATMKVCAPSAALVLASEFDRARQLTPWSISPINIDAWRRDVVNVLDEIGYFKLLEIPRPQVAAPTDPNRIRIVPFRTGHTRENEEVGNLVSTLADMIIEAHNVTTPTPEPTSEMHRLFDALIEAMENVLKWAYPDAQNATMVKNWWMTGAVDASNKRLTIVVYDQGVSIPARLPEWAGYSLVKKGFKRLFGDGVEIRDQQHDAAQMHLAMSARLSSATGMPHHGKGFPAFKTAVDICKKGRLRIISRRGEFIYETGSKAVGRVLNTPLQGTLIEWDLWL